MVSGPKRKGTNPKGTKENSRKGKCIFSAAHGRPMKEIHNNELNL